MRERGEKKRGRIDPGIKAKTRILIVGLALVCVLLLIGGKYFMDRHAGKPEKSNISATPTDVNQPRYLQGHQKKDFYYSLSPQNGFIVFVWEESKDEYRCGIIEGNIRWDVSQEALGDMTLRQGISLEEMKDVLSYYNLPEDRIVIEPYVNPASSYASVRNQSYEEYKEFLRSLFFR